MDILILQAAKVVTTVATVMVLAWVAERVSTRTAGLLSGFPLGTAIALAFIAIEQGPEFAAASASHALLGFLAALAMTTAYLFCLKLSSSAIWAPLAGILAFIAANGGLSLISGGLWRNLAVAGAGVALIAIAYKNIPSVNIAASVRLTYPVLFLRGFLSSTLVLAVTAIAYLGNTLLAGLFAAFPVTFLPLLLIVHLSYGPEPASTLIKFYPIGLGSLLAYTLTVALTYDNLGALTGTLAGFVVAVLYLALLGLIRQRAEQKT
ncbi:conserved hypothetical protein [Hahella chejuensis KCTC 2396]|uniref:Uncharacterized protein n=1 Tax=Hahella chejuensis (strain KCTC 2396) TaxID=349521 RepID=Q2SQ50_HAHCH|nr:hypothetical protein [Hahella chejuensis]ABC27224.1 conserved hypothetical protein [Hahella chejuensis KCTC 2396]